MMSEDANTICDCNCHVIIPDLKPNNCATCKYLHLPNNKCGICGDMVPEKRHDIHMEEKHFDIEDDFRISNIDFEKLNEITGMNLEVAPFPILSKEAFNGSCVNCETLFFNSTFIECPECGGTVLPDNEVYDT